MRRVVKTAAVVAVVLLLLGGASVLWVYTASQQVPEFYDVAVAVKPKDQAVERDAFVARAAALASDLQSDGHWHSLFTADEINAWLALELAANYPDLLPVELRDPRISLSPGAATIGCRYRSGELETVVSITLDAYLQAPNVLRARPPCPGRRLAGAAGAHSRRHLAPPSSSTCDSNGAMRTVFRSRLITFPPVGDSKSFPPRLDSIEPQQRAVRFWQGRAPAATGCQPIVPEPLRVPTASLAPPVDEQPGSDDQPRVRTAEKDTVHK